MKAIASMTRQELILEYTLLGGLYDSVTLMGFPRNEIRKRVAVLRLTKRGNTDVLYIDSVHNGKRTGARKRFYRKHVVAKLIADEKQKQTETARLVDLAPSE